MPDDLGAQSRFDFDSGLEPHTDDLVVSVVLAVDHPGRIGLVRRGHLQCELLGSQKHVDLLAVRRLAVRRLAGVEQDNESQFGLRAMTEPPTPEDIGVADERADESRFRTVVNVVGSADLLDLSVMHNRDPVGQRERLLAVVGDEHGGGVGRLEDVAHRQAQAGAEMLVEVAERFVEQHRSRLRRERARQRDPLRLATRQFVRISIAESGQSDQLQHLFDSGQRRFLTQPAQRAGPPGSVAVG